MALVDKSVAVPKVGNALEVATEGRGGLANELAWFEVVAPRIVVNSIRAFVGCG